jgi:hypothetical protein
MWGRPTIPRAVRLFYPVTLGGWPLAVEDLDEPDGGTFYRPERPNWISGSGVPDPGAGDEDDYYMDTNAEPPEWYGPKGEEDEDGDGDWGDPTLLPSAGDGEWIHGSGDPDDDYDGDDGDFYLDTSEMAWWGPKAAGLWAKTGPHFVRESWVTLTDGPGALGFFSLPACELAVGNSEETGALAADAWIELADADRNIFLTIHAASLTTDGGQAIRTGSAPFLLRVSLLPKRIERVRWKIVGDKGLKWSGAGGLTRLF